MKLSSSDIYQHDKHCDLLKNHATGASTSISKNLIAPTMCKKLFRVFFLWVD